jgi:hypothetical protein
MQHYEEALANATNKIIIFKGRLKIGSIEDSEYVNDNDDKRTMLSYETTMGDTIIMNCFVYTMDDSLLNSIAAKISIPRHSIAAVGQPS